MRFARVVVGLLVAFVGLLTAIAGAVAAFWVVGPDDTLDTGTQQVSDKGLAVVTAPDLLDRHGTTLHVAVQAADGHTPIFVGVGNDFDVTSYLGTARTAHVVGLRLPLRFDTQESTGGLTPLPAPAALDWWVAKARGATTSIDWAMADGRYDIVVMNAGGSPDVAAKVRVGLELHGAFATGLLVAGAGVLLLAAGLLLILFRRRRPDAPASYRPYVPNAQQKEGQGQRSEQGVGPARWLMVAVTTVSVLLAATGCVAVPPRNTGQSPGRPAVTVADGRAIVKRYNEINNKANQTRDGKLSATIEAQPVLGMTLASFTIGRATDPTGKERDKPFTYPNPQIGAPVFRSYPMRFVVASDLSTDKTHHQLGVWQRQNAGGAWLLSYSVYPPAGTTLPSMKRLRNPTQADLSGLSVLPQTAAVKLARYFTTGSRSPHAGAYAFSAETIKWLAENTRQRVARTRLTYISRVSDTYQLSGEPLTFVTESGEALVFATLTEQFLQQIKGSSSAYWNTGAATAFSNGINYPDALTEDYVREVAMVIPPKGGGKIRILSVDGQLVDAGGY